MDFKKGTLLGTPNREPQEYNRNIMEYKDPGRYIPIIFLLYSWGSLFGVPSKVPLFNALRILGRLSENQKVPLKAYAGGVEILTDSTKP